jgi:hypothetical protein
MKKQKIHFILFGVVKYMDDILLTTGIGLLAAAGFVIYLPLGLAVLGIGCIGYALFISLGK